jgi:hypothetical protein
MKPTEAEKIMIKSMIYSMLPQYEKLCSEVTPEFDSVINAYVESTHSLVQMLRRSMDNLLETRNIDDPAVNKLLHQLNEHIKHHLV